MSPPKSESLSRSQTGREHLAALADQLLRSSLIRPTTTVSAQAESDPSLSFAQTNAKSNHNPNRSLQRCASTSQVSPPSYSSATRFTSLLSQKDPKSSVERSSNSSIKKALQEEVNHARSQVKRPDSKELFKRLCSTDLMFVLDTTHSMKPYMNMVKEQVKSIVADIKSAFFGEAEVRIGIATYKDHNLGSHVKLLDFTSSLDEIHAFLDGLTTDWGKDFAEDVLGGLNAALNATWQHQTRCLIHIGDAPGHGSVLHDMGAISDDYYTHGSEPHGLTYEPLLRQFSQLRVNYAFLRVADYTDRMALVFAQAYGVGNAKLSPSNRYASEIETVDPRSMPGSLDTSSTKPQFEEQQLGTSYSELSHLVLKTVTSSVTRSAGSFTLMRSQEREKKSMFSLLGSIIEDANDPDHQSGEDICLETAQPQWEDDGWFDQTFDMEGYFPGETHNATTLQKMLDSDDNIMLGIANDVRIHVRSKPFAMGAMRAASYARTEASKNRFVIKSSIKGEQSRATVVEEMRVQALCKAFALEFNGLLKIEPPLDFVVSASLQSKTGARKECRSLEPYIEGKYVKYNSNSGWANQDSSEEFNLIAQAFSHFTFERSWGHLLINDLQGKDHLLTDPAVQTKSDKKFALTEGNIGEAGIKFFFIYHECNSFCKKLGLKSTRDMLGAGVFDFRETWPAMEPTVCCSNRFCQSIVRLEQSHKDDKYPGHQWCDKCYPQLEDYTTSHVCEGPGDDHEFEISLFFHESQGQAAPHECPEHRAPDVGASSAASVGGNLFRKSMARKPSEASISGKMW